MVLFMYICKVGDTFLSEGSNTSTKWMSNPSLEASEADVEGKIHLLINAHYVMMVGLGGSQSDRLSRQSDHYLNITNKKSDKYHEHKFTYTTK